MTVLTLGVMTRLVRSPWKFWRGLDSGVTPAERRELDGILARLGIGCTSPGCPELMRVDKETRVWRCPMHGPMLEA